MENDLFNFLTRHQVYLEGVKGWYHADFLRYMRQLSAALRKLFGGLTVDKLSDLTKRQYNTFLNKLRDTVKRVLGAHGEDWLLEVRRFARIDTTVQRSAFSALRVTKDFTSATIGKVWAAVRDNPIPAMGMTPKEAAEDLIARSAEQVKRTAVQGYADGETPKDTLTKLLGEEQDTFKDGTLRGIWNSGKAMISTVLQHAGAAASDFMGRILHGCYQWCSVLDTRTSPVCRERNGQIYSYSDGPQPPAHMNCRSRTIPCPCDADVQPVPTFLQWLRQQPEDFLTDAFGKGLGLRIKAGSAEVVELSAQGLIPNLSLADFEAKTAMLIS